MMTIFLVCSKWGIFNLSIFSVATFPVYGKFYYNLILWIYSKSVQYVFVFAKLICFLCTAVIANTNRLCICMNACGRVCVFREIIVDFAIFQTWFYFFLFHLKFSRIFCFGREAIYYITKSNQFDDIISSERGNKSGAEINWTKCWKGQGMN